MNFLHVLYGALGTLGLCVVGFGILIERILGAVRLATLEEACKAVCILCAEDAPIVVVNGDDYWHDTGGTNDLCYAGSIRRLMEPDSEEKDG